MAARWHHENAGHIAGWRECAAMGMDGFQAKIDEMPEIQPCWERSWRAWSTLQPHHIGGVLGMSSSVHYVPLKPTEVETHLRMIGVSDDLMRLEYLRVQTIGDAYVSVQSKLQAQQSDSGVVGPQSITPEDVSAQW